MGLFDFLLRKKDPDLCMIRDFIIIAKLNGDSIRISKEWILAEMKLKKIPEDKYYKVAKNPNHIKDCYPKDQQSQMNYLLTLISVSKTKGAQIYAAKKAKDMGLSKSLGVDV